SGRRHSFSRHPRGGRTFNFRARGQRGQVRRPEYPHYPWTRHRREGSSSTTANLPPRRPIPRPLPGLTVYPDPSAGDAVAILGAGGSSRPPIAPRFTGTPGQRAQDVAAALLNNKRHRPRELLAEVPLDAADSLRQTL